MGDRAPTSFRADLEEALALVSREAPEHFAAMRADLGARAARIRIGDGPPLHVVVTDGPPWVHEAEHEGDRSTVDLELALSRATLARLLRGEASIEEAILDESLAARGALPSLLAFFDALTDWLHGAFRSPSLPRLHAKCLARTLGAPADDSQKGSRPC